MKKVVRTSLNNVANKRGVRDLNIQLYSHDKNNAGFEFVIKNEVDLSEYKAKVLFDFQESFATWETKGTIEGNVVKVKFDTTFITKCEEVIGYLFLDSETDTLDVFKFKFNVVLSEIDKYDMAKRGFRYIKDQEVVDVITRSELEEELRKLQVNGGIDLSNYLTTTVAEETYVKKSDLPTPYNDSELVQKIGQLEARVDKDTVYDDTPLKQRVEALETKVDKDTKYDDTEVKRRLTELESKPTVDTSNFATKEELAKAVTKDELASKNYLTQHQPLDNLVTKEELNSKGYVTDELLNSKGYLTQHQPLTDYALKSELYNDTEVKERLTTLESRPNIDTSNFVTNEQLEGKRYLTEHQDISNLATNDELSKKVDTTEYDTFKEIVVTKDELAEKGYLTTQYDDTDVKNRIQALENRPSTGGTQTQDTGWITISDDNPLHGNVVKIRRINDIVHVSLSNPNSEGLQLQLDDTVFHVILANKEIGKGFTPLNKLAIQVTEIENIMQTTSGGTDVIGQVIFKVENGKVMINGFGDKFSTSEPKEVLVNDFSYFTEDPFPTNLQ